MRTPPPPPSEFKLRLDPESVRAMRRALMVDSETARNVWQVLAEKQKTKRGARPVNDPVNSPSHYTTGKIEVIDFIEDQKLGMHLGNAVKYIARAGKKNPDKLVEDLEKAVWYIERAINHLTTELEFPRDCCQSCGKGGVECYCPAGVRS